MVFTLYIMLTSLFIAVPVINLRSSGSKRTGTCFLKSQSISINYDEHGDSAFHLAKLWALPTGRIWQFPAEAGVSQKPPVSTSIISMAGLWGNWTWITPEAALCGREQRLLVPWNRVKASLSLAALKEEKQRYLCVFKTWMLGLWLLVNYETFMQLPQESWTPFWGRLLFPHNKIGQVDSWFWCSEFHLCWELC